MADIDLIQTNFSAGELSPKLLGRVDYNKYQAGAEALKRFLCLPQGGITKTPGTIYQSEVKNSANATRLVYFIFSAVQAYVIEFGNLYVRFYISEGQVESSPGVPLEVVTPYTSAQIWDIQFAQSADVLFLVHPNHAPRRLSRTSLTSWTLTAYNNVDGPYLDINISGTSLTPSATTGAVSITASGIAGINGGVGFRASDVGRWVRLRHSSTWGWAKITSITSTTVVQANVSSAFGAATATANWNLGAWTSDLGWPATIAFFEDRLFFGGNDFLPQTIWGTMSGDYYTFSPTETTATVSDDNGVVYGLASGQVNDIRWMDATKALIAGTASAEFSISGGSGDAALTPTNVKAFAATVRGSAKVMPVRVDSAILFVQKAKRKIREYSYDFGSDSFQAIDMSIISEHLTKGLIKEMAFQQEPYSIIWIVMEDGTLATLTYNREQEVIAWAEQPLGGNGKARSVTVIPSPTEAFDEVWLIVERTIDGVVRQYVEKFSNEFDPLDATDKDTAFYVDCGVTYSGAAATVISGLNHLEGEEVAVWGNGAVQPRRTVVSGSITLQTPVTYAVIGLPYTSRFRSIRYEGGNQKGTSQGKKKRVHKVVIRFLNTLTGKMGPTTNELEEIYFRAGFNPMGDSPPLFTGDKEVIFPGDYDLDGQIEIQSTDPAPMTILAIMPEMVVHS